MGSYAYVTLITRGSYLAGVVILAYSLRRQGSPHPLIVCYTETLPQECIEALEFEAPYSNLLLRPVEGLQPPSFSKADLIAERFGDTWTKLRVFEPWKPQGYPGGFDKLAYLDADMMLRKNLDYVFDIDLPGTDWLAASQCCVCNPDKDAWAPDHWNAANCAHSTSTTFSSPTTVPDSQGPKSTLTIGQQESYTSFNSGFFLFEPSLEMWKSVLDTFTSMSAATVKAYKFPDQDFLIDFFRDRWISIGWRVNALKTMRYCHPNMWHDDEAVNVHYIVDKPWAGPRPQWLVSTNGHGATCDGEKEGQWSAVGFRGRDGVTHSWWWQNWDSWKEDRETSGRADVVKLLQSYVYGGTQADASDMQAIGARVQSFANNRNKPNGLKAQ